MNQSSNAEFYLLSTDSLPESEVSFLEKYTHEVMSYPHLSPKEEKELAILAQQDDADALQKLTQSNLSLVLMIAKQYQNKGLSLKDLIAEGNIGLVKSVQKYNADSELPFRMFAIWWIRQTILQALAETSRQKRLKANQPTDVAKLQAIYAYLEEVLNREPTTKEMAEASLAHSISLPHARLLSALNEPVAQSDLISVVKWPIKPKDVSTQVLWKTCLKEQVDVFSEKERTITLAYLSENKEELESLSETYFLSAEETVAVLRKAYRKLRHYYRNSTE